MNTKLLEQMVSLKSIYPDEYRLGRFLQARLSDIGFQVMTQKISAKRYNIFASKGEGIKAVLFYGHLDTVPLTKITKWKTNPFKLSVRQGRLYGLGAYDMKGGIASFLDVCVKSKGYVKIFLAVDEENISEGAWNAVRQNRNFFSDVELIISPEPNFDTGLNGIVRGRTGRYIFTVSFEGKPAHVARYKEGIDSLEEMSKFMAKFYKTREKLFYSRGSFIQIRRVEGEAIGMSVCGNAALEVEVIANHMDSIDQIQQKIQSLTHAQVCLKTRKTPYLPGYYFKTFPYREIIGKTIQRNTSKKMELHTRMSVGDDNALATLGIPVITWGPDGGNAHAPNEYVEISSLDILSKMFFEFLETRELIVESKTIKG